MLLDKLRHQYMALWKDTFHDSDGYIRLIFERCFSEEWTVYETRQGSVVAALMGVPYEFCGFQTSGDSRSALHMRGMYLCGLATKPEFRRLGIMSSMLEQINRKASDAGFDFTFLIPADTGLRKYYADRGYIDCFRVFDNRYLPGHDFRAELKAIDTDQADDYDDLIASEFNNLSDDLKVSFIDFIRKYECHAHMLSIYHSALQIETAVLENALSDGLVLTVRDENNEPQGIAFCTDHSGASVVHVGMLISSTAAAKYRILHQISIERPGKEITVEIPEGGVLTGVNSSQQSHSKGMLRLLSKDRLLSQLYSLCGHNSAMARNLNISGSREMQDSLRGMNTHEVAEVLFRRYTPLDTLSHYLSLPTLPVSISLMLD